MGCVLRVSNLHATRNTFGQVRTCSLPLLQPLRQVGGLREIEQVFAQAVELRAGQRFDGGEVIFRQRAKKSMKLAHDHLDYLDYLIDNRPWLAGAQMGLADLAAAAQISVADYLGGIDWKGHEQSKGWYSLFKSRPSFRPLLAERMDVIQPPAHYAAPNA